MADVYQRQIAKKAPEVAEQHPVIIKPNQSDQALTQALLNVSNVLGNVSANYINAVNIDQLKTAQVYVADQIQQYQIAQEQQKVDAYEDPSVSGTQGSLSTDIGVSPTDRMINQQKDFEKFQDGIRKEVMEDMSYAGGKKELNLWLDEVLSNVNNEMTAEAVTESIGIMNARSQRRATDLMNKGEWELAIEERISAGESGVSTSVQVMADIQLIHENEAIVTTTKLGKDTFDAVVEKEGTDPRALAKAETAALAAIDKEKNQYLTAAMKEAITDEISQYYLTVGRQARELREFDSEELAEKFWTQIDKYRSRDDIRDIHWMSLKEDLWNNSDNLTLADYRPLLQQIESMIGDDPIIPSILNRSDIKRMQGPTRLKDKQAWLISDSALHLTDDERDRLYAIAKEYELQGEKATEEVAFLEKMFRDKAIEAAEKGDYEKATKWTEAIMEINAEFSNYVNDPTITIDELQKSLSSFIIEIESIEFSQKQFAQDYRDNDMIVSKFTKQLTEYAANALLMLRSLNPTIKKNQQHLLEGIRNELIANHGIYPFGHEWDDDDGLPVLKATVDGKLRYFKAVPINNGRGWHFISKSHFGEFEEYNKPTLKESKIDRVNQIMAEQFADQNGHPQFTGTRFENKDMEIVVDFFQTKDPFKSSPDEVVKFLDQYTDQWDIDQAKKYIMALGIIEAKEEFARFPDGMKQPQMVNNLAHLLYFYQHGNRAAEHIASQIVMGQYE